MQETVLPSDLSFFSTLSGCGSLSAAARELGLTAAAVSKHLTQMESRAGVALVNRTTRRMMLTPEGELYLEHARRILDDIDALSQLLGSAKRRPEGLLRVNATLGFGRSHVALYRRLSAGVGAAAVVGDAAAADRRRLRRLHPFWRAARHACDRPPAGRQPAPVLRRAGVSGAARHAAHAARSGQASVHRHPPGRRGLWRMAHDDRRQDRDGQDTRRIDHQRRRHRRQLGAGRPRHPDARGVGLEALSAGRPPGPGAAELCDAERRYLRRLFAAAPAIEPHPHLCRFHRPGIGGGRLSGGGQRFFAADKKKNLNSSKNSLRYILLRHILSSPILSSPILSCSILTSSLEGVQHVSIFTRRPSFPRHARPSSWRRWPRTR